MQEKCFLLLKKALILLLTKSQQEAGGNGRAYLDSSFLHLPRQGTDKHHTAVLQPAVLPFLPDEPACLSSDMDVLGTTIMYFKSKTGHMV